MFYPLVKKSNVSRGRLGFFLVSLCWLSLRGASRLVDGFLLFFFFFLLLLFFLSFSLVIKSLEYKYENLQLSFYFTYSFSMS